MALDLISYKKGKRLVRIVTNKAYKNCNKVYVLQRIVEMT